MFTGIVEELGEVKNISRKGRVALLEIKADKTLEDTVIGDSISVNGVCLTAVKKKLNTFSFEVMQETLAVTNLGGLRIKDRVNLERALKIGDRISGHFVTGHIDCVGIIRQKKYINDNLCFAIAFPFEFSRYIFNKGSVALDGISLTVADKKANIFSVYIIPHTSKNTTLGFKGTSDKVNIEFDILAKRGMPNNEAV